jgi:hypothetical protein
LSEASNQVNQPIPAFPISFLTVAKRLYRIALGFFLPGFGSFRPAASTRFEGNCLKSFPQADRACCDCEKNSGNQNCRVDAVWFAGCPEPVKALS